MSEVCGMANCEKVIFPASIGGQARVVGFFYPTLVPEPKGVVQICHGMAEYIARYDDVINHFNLEGWHVAGLDMLGHGESYLANEPIGMPKGYFGKGKDAMAKTIQDIMKLHWKAKERFGSNLPYILYGHSMGSMVARYIYSTPEYASEFKGFVFASTSAPNPAVGAGLFLSSLACLVGRGDKPGKLLNVMAFGSYCKRIPGAKTGFEWICTDQGEVDRYVEDPMCGFMFTNEGFRAMMTMMKFIQSKKAYLGAATAPALMPYGAEDPVGGYGEGVEKVAAALNANGHSKVRTINYGAWRHELMREGVREQYLKDLTDFYEVVVG